MDKVGRTEPWCLCDVSLSCPQIHPWAINLTLWLKTTHLCWCMCVCQVWLLISQQMLVISLVAFDHLEVFWRAWGRYLKHFAIICFVRVCVYVCRVCVSGVCAHIWGSWLCTYMWHQSKIPSHSAELSGDMALHWF